MAFSQQNPITFHKILFNTGTEVVMTLSLRIKKIFLKAIFPTVLEVARVTMGEDNVNLNLFRFSFIWRYDP